MLSPQSQKILLILNVLAKRIVKESFGFFGFELSRYKGPSPLLHHKIDLLFDVGANIGQYALLSRGEGYAGKIISFEPLSMAYSVLAETAKSDRLWVVHERCAIGSTNGEIEINVAGNSYSSSILPMLRAHSDVAPQSAYTGKDSAKIVTLDSIFYDYRTTREKVFLKIDTQGFERAVLEGAKNCLRDIHAIQLELSLIALYEGQELYEYFFSYLKDAGFEIWSLVPGFSDSRTGQSLQFDAVFVRP
ncbi:methyltransferase, FkbM family [Nitrosospira sp. Nsp14]|uniref:FkbM family methyltransferase n=1 Tax=Nitrosospira sp. Nsp14 TaxID=1855333 RepID=UPI0008E7CC7E|nr:FkbM family methyltransferase [Nitrosospira sp. Nsp14]SFH17890.1 methyltransferase, FkbM family [Nitrosospira sp. Nsp14]